MLYKVFKIFDCHSLYKIECHTKRGACKRICSTLLVLSVFLATLEAQVHSEHIQNLPNQVFDSLSLDAAINLAFMHNSRIKAQQLEIAARYANVTQAELFQNPELTLELENISGTGPYRSAKSLQSGLLISQVFELSNKRKLRGNLGKIEKAKAEWEYQQLEIQLMNEVRIAFFQTLAAQKRLEYLEQALKFNQQLLETATLRYQAGKASETDRKKAKIVYALAHIDFDKAQQEWHSAKIILASKWNTGERSKIEKSTAEKAGPKKFDVVKGSLGDLSDIPATISIDSLISNLGPQASLMRQQSEQAYWGMQSDLARAEKIPPLSISTGIRHIRDGASTELSWLANFSIPLPIFNRQQANLREMKIRKEKSREEFHTLYNEVSSQLKILHHALLTGHEEVNHLRDELIPEAKGILESSEQAYKMGRLSFLEVLDSQKTLNELQSRLILVLTEYHRIWFIMHTISTAGSESVSKLVFNKQTNHSSSD